MFRERERERERDFLFKIPVLSPVLVPHVPGREVFIATDTISDMSKCLSLYVHVLPCFVVCILVTMN